MSFEPEEKPLEDAELEMVVQVIRRGLKNGNTIEELETKCGKLAALANEAGRRLKEVNRIGQEIVRKFERVLDPRRPKPLTVLEATETLRWLKDRSDRMKEQLE